MGKGNTTKAAIKITASSFAGAIAAANSINDIYEFHSSPESNELLSISASLHQRSSLNITTNLINSPTANIISEGIIETGIFIKLILLVLGMRKLLLLKYRRKIFFIKNFLI